MRKLIIVLCILALLGGSVYTVLTNGPIGASGSAPTAEPIDQVRAPSTVTATGRVVPIQYGELSAATSGTVLQVLVDEGDQVDAGAVLAQLDDSAQRAKIAVIETELAQAKANYTRLQQGATPEELQAAEAAVAQSQAQLRQVVSSVSPDDIRAAEAQLTQAQQQLARLQAGPDLNDLRAADAQLLQAQQQLVTQRDSLSAAKTNAQIQLEQSANALQQAQIAYSAAKWNWEQVQATGRDPFNPQVPNPSAPDRPLANELNNVQKQQYYDTFVKTELALRNAEQAVEQQQVAYDTARQAEISGVQAAEQAVAGAQAQLNRTRSAVTPELLAAARAQLATAQANLAKLRGDQHSSAIDAAEAGVVQSRANLDRLQAGTNDSDLIVAQAQVANAQARLDLEKALLEQYVLQAPFAGTVAALDLRPSSYVVPGTPLVRIGDLSSWQIITDDLTELKVVDIREGDPVMVTLDALPDVRLTGTVSQISPFGEQKQGDVIYNVKVSLTQPDPRLHWNMTAVVTIEPRQRPTNATP